MNPDPTPAPPDAKALCRDEARARLRTIGSDDWARRSAQVCTHLRALDEYRSARSILAYLPIPGEVEIQPLIAEALHAGVHLSVPRLEPGGRMHALRITNLHADTEPAPGFRHVRQARAGLPPVDPATIQCVLVPGLAFDARGGRLGRGQGYYDRLLATLRHAHGNVFILGIAIDPQLIDRVPTDAHDQRMDAIITESRTIRCRPA